MNSCFQNCAGLLVIALALAQAHGATLLDKQRIVESKVAREEWHNAAQGAELVVGEFVRTGADSRAKIGWSSAVIAQLRALSQMRIPPGLPLASNTLAPGASLLDIRNGEVYLHFSAKAGAGTVVSPLATISHTQTEMLVRVAADGTTTLFILGGSAELRNSRVGVAVGIRVGEAGIVEPGKPARKTAVIKARSELIEWCLYYPGVLHLPDLKIPAAEARALHASIAAYAGGDLLGALDRWPAHYAARSPGAKILRAMVLLAVGQVDDARKALASVPREAAGRRAIEEMILAVNGIDADAVRTASNSNKPGTGRTGPRVAGAGSAEPAFRIPPMVLVANLKIGRAADARSTASEWLAHSYYEQSRTRLESALDAARSAAALAPDFGYAWVRVAELEFSFGRVREAKRALGRGEKLAPGNAQAQALHGFLLSAENRIGDAIRCFDRAIAMDGALGNAWLGRGLCLIRRGRVAEGVEQVKIAAVQEPQRSLYRSYLGKAFHEASETGYAGRELQRAIQLDPNDPTPWLYSALSDETGNRLNLAISELQESIDRNDNRRLYRSGLLLDQDRAVRSANLARIYQRAGLDDVAVREATRAVESDYTNGSAHLFLANSFDALRDPTRIQLRYETAWFNELLLANLLSPVGGGSLSQFVSQQEYSKLFEGDGTHVSSFTEWRSDGVFRENASIFGTYGNFSFALDGSHYWQGGTRPNNGLTLSELYFNLKYQVTPDDTFLFLTKWANQRQGDLFQTFDNLPLDSAVSFKEKQEPGLLLGGWNHRWAPGVNTLFLGGRLSAEQFLRSPATTQTLVQRDAAGLTPGFLTRDPMLGDSFTNPALAADPNAVTLGPDGETLSYSPAFTAGIQPYIGRGMAQALGTDTFDFYTLRRFELTTLELQQIWQTKCNTALAGVRWVEGHFDTDAILTLSRPTFSGRFTTPASSQRSETAMHQLSLYAYDYFRPTKWVTLIGGVSWDHLEHPDNFRNPPVNDSQRKVEKVSGKVGFTLEPSRWITIRGVYGESLGGVTFDESVRLEPVQIAGFNQAFRTIISESISGSVEAPLYKYRGISIDGHLPTRTWWGVTINTLQEDVDRTLGVFDGYDSGVFPSSPAYFPSSQRQRLGYREETLSASIQQLIGSEFSISAGYRYTHSRLHSTFPELNMFTPNADQQGEGILHHLIFAANWNSPTGLFARAEANWYNQRLRGTDFQRGTTGRPGDDFWQFDALVGCRFARNRCEVTAGILNLADTNYQLDPINYMDTLPRSRTAVLRCKITF